jgi:hypothetical protein
MAIVFLPYQIDHYRKTGFRRMPDSSPCAVYRAHSELKLHRVLFLARGEVTLHRVLFLCLFLAHDEVKVRRVLSF